MCGGVQCQIVGGGGPVGRGGWLGLGFERGRGFRLDYMGKRELVYFAQYLICLY